MHLDPSLTPETITEVEHGPLDDHVPVFLFHLSDSEELLLPWAMPGHGVSRGQRLTWMLSAGAGTWSATRNRCPPHAMRLRPEGAPTSSPPLRIVSVVERHHAVRFRGVPGICGELP